MAHRWIACSILLSLASGASAQDKPPSRPQEGLKRWDGIWEGTRTRIAELDDPQGEAGAWATKYFTSGNGEREAARVIIDAGKDRVQINNVTYEEGDREIKIKDNVLEYRRVDGNWEHLVRWTLEGDAIECLEQDTTRSFDGHRDAVLRQGWKYALRRKGADPSPPGATPPPAVAPVTDAVFAEQKEEMERLFKVYRDVRRMEDRIKHATVELGLAARAANDLRVRIELLERAAKDEALDEEARAAAAAKLPELASRLKETLQAQEKLVDRVGLEHHELALLTEHAFEKTGSAEIRNRLKIVRDALQEQDDLLPLQLYLSAGRRDKFDEKARDLVARHARVPAVYRLRAVDYINHGDPRSALYALRKSLELSPQSKPAQQMLRDLEQGYLRGIAAKRMGDAAEVHARLNEALMGKGEAGWLNAVKDVVTTGVTTSAAAIAGKVDALTDLAVKEMDQAAVEHTGLEVVMRLHRDGHALAEIASMSTEALGRALGGGPSMDRPAALRLRLAVSMALKNPDVQRLTAPSKEQFDVDRGTSTLATDAFDVTWLDHAGDAVNVANVATLLPGAVVGRTARISAGGEIVQEERTVAAAIASSLKLERLQVAMEGSAAGRAALKDLTRFQENGGVVSKMLAQALLDEGIVQAGKAVGGDMGELAAQIVTSVGATDIDDIASRLMRRGVSPRDVRKLLARTEAGAAALSKAKSTVPQDVAGLGELIDAMRSRPTPSSTVARMRKSADEVDAGLRSSLDTGYNRALAPEIHRQQTLKDTLVAVSENRPGHAVATRKMADEIGREAADQARALEGQIAGVTRVVRKMDEVGATRVAAGNARGTLGPARLTRKSPAAARPGVEPPVEPADAFLRKADEVFHLKDRGAAQHHYAAILESQTLGLDEQQMIVDRMRLINRLEALEQARREQAAVAKARGLNARVAEPFDDGEMRKLKSIEGVPLDDMRPFKYADGRPSHNQPRFFKDPGDGAREMGIFKPTTTAGDVENELIAHRLKGALGIESFATARAAAKGADGRRVEGVAQRFVVGRSSENLTVEELILHRQAIAEDKVVSTLLGDYDRHLGNYYLSVNGKLYSIDHGMAQVGGQRARFLEPGGSKDPGKWRAAVKEEMEYYLQVPKDPNLAELHRHIFFEHMEAMVSKVEKLKPEELKGILGDVYGAGPEAVRKIEEAMEAMTVRQQLLREVLQDMFKPLRSN